MAHSILQGWSDYMENGGPNGALTYPVGYGPNYEGLTVRVDDKIEERN